jgi:hypothetical protein
MVGLTKRDAVFCEGFVAFDRDGLEHFVVVVKWTYTLPTDGAPRLHDDPVPVLVTDMYWGDPGTSSIRYEADTAYHKPRVDVLVNGSAWAPHGRPVTELPVELSTRFWTKTIHVSGDRRWARGISGLRSSPPMPFLQMPVRWERAFGGVDALTGRIEVRNPVGVGFGTPRNEAEGTRLPNLETPQAPQTRWNEIVPPVGLSAVDRSWEPRRRHAGTYDEEWKRQRFPFLPLDFDERFFQNAPEDQYLERYVPGEPIALRNLSPRGDLVIHLPPCEIPVYARFAGRRERFAIVPDSVLIEPDADRLVLSGRLRIKIGVKADRLREVIVGRFPPGEERAFLSGKRYLSSSALDESTASDSDE